MFRLLMYYRVRRASLKILPTWIYWKRSQFHRMMIVWVHKNDFFFVNFWKINYCIILFKYIETDDLFIRIFNVVSCPFRLLLRSSSRDMSKNFVWIFKLFNWMCLKKMRACRNENYHILERGSFFMGNIHLWRLKLNFWEP
jgi:hypothetical protein